MVDEEKTMNPLRLQRLASKKELPKKFAVRWKCMFSTKYVSKPKKQAKPWGDSAISRFLSHGKAVPKQHYQVANLTVRKKKCCPLVRDVSKLVPFPGRVPETSHNHETSEKWDVFNRIVTPFIFTEPWKFGKRVPSWQRTYPHSRYIWVDDLPFERPAMLVPWEGTPLTAPSTLYTSEV